MKRRDMVTKWMRTRKTRRTSGKRQLSLQPLESRELMAVMAAFDLQAVRTAAPQTPSVNVASNSQPATTAELSPVAGGESVTGPGTTATNSVIRDLATTTTGTIFVDPPPPPELGAKFENGVLTVTGSHKADNLFIYASEGKVHVREVVKDLILLSVTQADVKNIVVNANGGDDWVNVDEESIGIPATLRGNSGNDTLLGGAAGDKLYGGSGDDEILGRGGKDTLRGEHGDDLLVGGDGDDVIFGGFGNDYLVGGKGNDWLMGEEGDDQMFGEAGNDLMFGGPGENLMDGGDGDDAIYGGEDVDAVYGGNGNDFIRGFAGDDQLRGEGGNDIIIADEGDDLVDGGDGHDAISGDLGNDVLSGGNGNDTISGGHGQDWLDGAAGNDVLHGGAGNDWLQGGAGADQLNGAAGDDKVYQSYPEGHEQIGQITQALSWGDVWDAAEAVGDFIVDVVKWTIDKAEAIGLRFYSWAANFDDRLVRLGEDLAGALTNWPWEADFWKGLGRTVVDTLEIAGLAEAWDIAFEILKPWQRGMTSREIAVAQGVFGDSIPWNMVRFDEYSLIVALPATRTHTLGYVINSWGDIDDETMIHELTHVWQYVTAGLVYLPEAAPDSFGENYEYGGPTRSQQVADLRAKMNAGRGLSAYNREQQGKIVQDYWVLREEARQYEQDGTIAPLSLRQDLDVYIHFVKEVSTLSPAELDTPDPVVLVRPIVTEVAPVVLAPSSPGTPIRFGGTFQGTRFSFFRP